MNVTKRDGTVESIDLDKIHKVVEWACEGLENVSVSEIELKAHIQMFDGIETSVIHELLIRSAADLISVETPDYQYVAARLAIFHMRKVVFGGYTPPDLNYFIKHMVAKGLYDADLLNLFTDEERLELDLVIQHDNDLNFAYAAIQQWEGKYLVQDRVTKQLYETPQFAYMAISMVLFQNEDASIRMHLIKEMYKELTEGRISLPTPIMGGLRTPTRQFSSCVVIEAGDSLDSINAASNAIVKYVSQRAGIGINFGRIRALGSKIRNGEAKHTGVIPFLKLFQAAVKSCSQGALRGGAATAFYPIWHLEVQSLLVLKNNRGVEENRVRNLDYGVQLNKLMYQRLLTKGNITLFSPSDVPGLYEAFFADQELFEQLYTKYETDDSIRKESISAVELFSTLLQERAQTGRIYIMNVDHTNTHSSFTDTIRQSNLCVTGDTKILTREGYKPIAELVGQTVECWNGREWSNTPIFQTSEGQEVLEVKLSNGSTIKATPYHKWYVAKQDTRGKLIGEVEKRTLELEEGDKLVKFKLEPVNHGTKVLENAYTNGFHTADGTVYKETNKPRISLYGDKQLLTHRFESYDTITYDNSGRVNVNFKRDVLRDKFFVPDSSYTVESRVAWLSGLLDGDGTLTNNAGTESIQITSTNEEFIFELMLLLQELGVQARFSLTQKEGYRKMPANDGTGTKKDFWCKATYRLLIPGSSINHLLDIGLSTERLDPTRRVYNREATQFIKVVSVEDNGLVEPTYCGTEPKRHRLMFNGVLTGNCMEISLPTTEMGFDSDEPEIALCTLAAFNLGVSDLDNRIERSAYLIVRALDNLLDYQDYPMKAAEKAKLRRSLGIGVTNYAYWLAKNGLFYSNGSANNATHRLFESIQFSLLKASMQLAKEKGACGVFERTKYAKGLLPIDHYKKEVDDVHTQALLKDWEWLRGEIAKHGLRNSTLTAQMPCETSSQITNSTNGIEPPRGLVSVKASKDGVFKQVVPESNTLFYELLWDIPSNQGYLELNAIMQKFIDQSISTNTNYDPEKFADGKVPITQLIKDLVLAYKLGIKTLYYHNTRDGSGDAQQDDGCASGACKL